jgi:hypothetical protein
VTKTKRKIIELGAVIVDLGLFVILFTKPTWFVSAINVVLIITLLWTLVDLYRVCKS